MYELRLLFIYIFISVSLCILNCCSVKWSSRMTTVLTFVKLVPLVAILSGGIYNIAMGKT
jgi:amino acid transporter